MSLAAGSAWLGTPCARPRASAPHQPCPPPRHAMGQVLGLRCRGLQGVFCAVDAPPRATSTSGRAAAQDPRSKRFWTTSDMPELDGKVYVVTGGSSGMGWYCAKALAEHGAHVIIAARNLDRCETAAKMIKGSGARGKVDAMHLDLSSFKSITEFAKAFQARDLPLDTLVNNAGVFLVPHDRTQEGFETTVGTNYFGPFLLTHLLLDKLKASAPARIVSMASLFEMLGSVPWDDLPGYKARESGLFEYSNSKVMVIMMVRELNKRLQGTRVEAFASQPGLVQTELNGRKLDHRKLTAVSVDLATKVYGQHADKASVCLTRPASDPNVEGFGGSYFSPPWLWLLALKFDHAGMREPGNSLARDEGAWRTLYNMTLDIVNEKLKEKGLPIIEAAGPPR